MNEIISLVSLGIAGVCYGIMFYKLTTSNEQPSNFNMLSIIILTIIGVA